MRLLLLQHGYRPVADSARFVLRAICFHRGSVCDCSSYEELEASDIFFARRLFLLPRPDHEETFQLIIVSDLIYSHLICPFVASHSDDHRDNDFRTERLSTRKPTLHEKLHAKIYDFINRPYPIK